MSETNIAALGWAGIFKQDNPMIELPKQLSKKWWDKEKQVIAKGSATGLSDELDKLVKAFNAIEWPIVGRGSSKEIRQAQVNKCTKLINSAEMKNFREQLVECEKKAKQWAIKWKPNPLLKKTVSALEDIRDISAQLKGACLPNSLGTALDEAIKAADVGSSQKTAELVEGSLLKLIKQFDSDLPGLVKTMNDKLSAFAKSPEGKTKTEGNSKIASGEITTRNALAESISNLCRRSTTLLGNLLKAKDVPGLDSVAVGNLVKSIAVISADKEFKFIAPLNAKTAASLVQQVERWMTETRNLAKKVDAG